ncbi:Pentatricopeptide repeat-containing protein [Platanthera zijinensis]|uniref:Pentatricopeptide repeat-containing protein n=1 Tax=Platanthera zijinensis TaxID=2320716 RepID=A0AAP0FVP5_9ASPA
MSARVILHCIYSSSAINRSSESNQRRNPMKIGTSFSPANANRKQSQSPNFNSTSIARALISAVESGQMVNALTLFQTLRNPDNFHWNVMIRGYTNNGEHEEAIQFYSEMLCAGYLPDNFTLPSVIKSCAKLLSSIQGLKIHGHIFKLGLNSDIYICNSLIAMYSKLGRLESAEMVFLEMPARAVVSWNTMIDGYVSNGEGSKSLSCFRSMVEEDSGVKPDVVGAMSAIEACSMEILPKSGREIHCYIIRQQFESEIKVMTTLLDMYCNCGEMNNAERLFDVIPKENVVVWNVLINGYFLNGRPEMAVESLVKMEEFGMEPGVVTMVNLLPSLTLLRSSSYGRAVHGFSIRKGLLPHSVLQTAFTSMYAKRGELRSAKLLFDMLFEKSLVSWNVMIAAYVQNGKSMEAMSLFQLLLMEGEPLLKPDVFTISSIIPAYSELASLRQGKQIHGYVFKLGYHHNTLTLNSIMYMYAKCGDLKASTTVFDKMPLRGDDVVTWNTIILAHALHGFGKTALEKFSDMKRQARFQPNESTFFSVLSACSVSGLMNEAWMYYEMMQSEHNLHPQIEHYGCIVDLLGRAGELEKAMEFIERMPVTPTSRIWGSLLTAGRNNGRIEVAEFAAERILQLDHDNTGCYVILHGMYADAGRWDEAGRVISAMKANGLHRTKGRSFVELDHQNCNCCSFEEGERSHDEINTIELVSDILSAQIGEGDGFTDKLQDSGTKKSIRANRHSVRLAVCFGLISSAVGKPILVKKNVRICRDCHGAMKKISGFTGREIVVGDSRIYHHFKDGICGCGDYWCLRWWCVLQESVKHFDKWKLRNSEFEEKLAMAVECAREIDHRN